MRCAHETQEHCSPASCPMLFVNVLKAIQVDKHHRLDNLRARRGADPVAGRSMNRPAIGRLVENVEVGPVPALVFSGLGARLLSRAIPTNGFNHFRNNRSLDQYGREDVFELLPPHQRYRKLNRG